LNTVKDIVNMSISLEEVIKKFKEQ